MAKKAVKKALRKKVKKASKSILKKKTAKRTGAKTSGKKKAVKDPLARKHGEGRVYPDEDDEQGISPAKSSLQKREAMSTGDADEDLDTREGREAQVEEDEVEPWEAGFAEGASDESIHGKDALTGQPLMDVENVVETEIDGKNYRFASEKNALKFMEKMKKKKN
ncbi:hypothetical protein HYX13_01875 [Candidatus Woesearchaeota archaeon]|nr:hypothetical protein [Candidatus Woesearchaeota archaeon]